MILKSVLSFSIQEIEPSGFLTWLRIIYLLGLQAKLLVIIATEKNKRKEVAKLHTTFIPQ